MHLLHTNADTKVCIIIGWCNHALQCLQTYLYGFSTADVQMDSKSSTLCGLYWTGVKCLTIDLTINTVWLIPIISNKVSNSQIMISQISTYVHASYILGKNYMLPRYQHIAVLVWDVFATKMSREMLSGFFVPQPCLLATWIPQSA